LISGRSKNSGGLRMSAFGQPSSSRKLNAVEVVTSLTRENKKEEKEVDSFL